MHLTAVFGDTVDDRRWYGRSPDPGVAPGEKSASVAMAESKRGHECAPPGWSM